MCEKDGVTCWGEETCGGVTWGWGPYAAVTRGTGAPCGERRAPCSWVTRDHPGEDEELLLDLGLTWPY